MSSIPDAILVSGPMAGAPVDLPTLTAVRSAVPAEVPVLVNTGVRSSTVAELLGVVDGCIVGSDLKVDGSTWNPVDTERAARLRAGGPRAGSRLTAVPVTVGIDQGTTATKVVVVDARDLTALAAVAAPVGNASPAPGWSEADPEEWWANVVGLVPAALTAAGVDRADVVGVAVTSMIPAVVLTDQRQRPLRPAILQNDARAVAELTELRAETASLPLLTETGAALSQQSVGPTWRWLVRHEPAITAATSSLVGAAEFIAMRLGAPPHAEANWWLEAGFARLDGTPYHSALEAAEVPAGVLPVSVTSATVVGAVTVDAAASTGLRAGTPIVAGGADHVLSAAAAGVLRPGDGLVKLGGAGDLVLCADLRGRRSRLVSRPASGDGAVDAERVHGHDRIAAALDRASHAVGGE